MSVLSAMHSVQLSLVGVALWALLPAVAVAASSSPGDLDKNRPFGVVDDGLLYVFGKGERGSAFLDPKLAVGIVLYVSYWAMVYTDRAGWYCTRWLEIGSLDVIMLTLWQHFYVQQVLPLITILAALHFGVNSYLIHRTSRFKGPGYTASNLYQDLKCTMGRVTTVFAGQILMVVYYMTTLTTMRADQNDVSYAFWVTAVIGVQMAALFGRGADSQLGFAFHGHMWKYMLFTVKEIEVVVDGKATPLPISRCELWTRASMAFLINEVLRSVVGVSMPLILMASEDPKGFLLDCLALAFIFQLDDTSTGGTYNLVAGPTEGPEASEAEP